MPFSHATLADPELDARLAVDIARARRRRTVFALLSVGVVASEVVLAAALLLATMRDAAEDAVSFAAISTFVLTFDAAFGLRERAAAHHAALLQLRGIRDQMRHPLTSPLWQEYGAVRAYTRISYLEAVFDGLGRAPDPPPPVDAATHAPAAAPKPPGGARAVAAPPALTSTSTSRR